MAIFSSSFWRRRCFGWIALSAAIQLGVCQVVAPAGDNGVKCFYPDGDPAIDYQFVPCSPGKPVSACCVPSEGDVCLPSGLCNWTDHYPYRGACTSRNWGAGCPNFCSSSKLSLSLSLSLSLCVCVCSLFLKNKIQPEYF